jgi:hypothetical protein
MFVLNSSSIFFQPANSLPLSQVIVFITSDGKSFNNSIIALVTVSSFLSGIHLTKYNLVFLSANDTKQYLLFKV